VGGGSIGGPLAAGLYGLAHRQTFDRGVGLTATVTAGGKLGHVEGIPAKILAGVGSGVKKFVLSPEDHQAYEHEKAKIPNIDVVSAENVEKALAHLTGLVDDLIGEGLPGTAAAPRRRPGYLVALARQLSAFPWPLLRPGTEFFRDLHVQVRVSSERRDPDKDREDERRRRAGERIGPEEEGEGKKGRSAYRHPADEDRFQEEKPAEPPMPWYNPEVPERSGRKRFPWAVLLADPGMGKTTLLRYEGWLTCRQEIDALRTSTKSVAEIVLPVYLRLADLATVLDEPDMVEAVARLATDPRRGGVEVSAEIARLLRQKLRDGQAVLLLDAMDEVPARFWDKKESPNLFDWLKGWTTQHPPGRLYLSSRLVGYPGAPFPLDPPSTSGPRKAELELVAFGPEEVQRFVTAFLGEQIDPEAGTPLAEELWRQLQQHPGMMGLAQTPLLLTLICLAFAHAGKGRKLRLPYTRCKLYRECLEGLLGRWPNVRRRQTGDDANLSDEEASRLGDKRELLAAVAWKLSSDDAEHTLFRRVELKEALKRCPEQLTLLGWTPEAALDELGRADGILIRTGSAMDAVYHFLHRTFQEYLLAWALARETDWLTTALERAYDPAWSIPLSLLGGVLDQQDEDSLPGSAEERSRRYLIGLLRENGQDLLCRPMLIAGHAAGEAKCLRPSLVQNLADVLVANFLHTPDFLDHMQILRTFQPLFSVGESGHYALTELRVALRGTNTMKPLDSRCI
jgi:hypothetical protein